MAKSRVFLIFSLSAMAGVFCRSFFEADYLFAKFALLALAVIISAVFFKNKLALAIAGALLFFLLGIWRTEGSLNKLSSLQLDGREFSANVIVSKEPERKDDYQNIIVELARPMSKLRISINANKYLPVKYGDELKIICVLKIPDNKSDEFNYRMYLAKDGIYYLCQNTQVEKTGSNRGNRFYIAILKLKSKMEENINRVIPQPEAALASGLILGGSSRMSKEVQNNFSKTGMTHIVAVSGYNVTIIAEYLMILGIFLGLWRKQAFWFAVVGIILFVLMVGFPSSAVRAGVMGVLLIWAMKNGRLANSYNAIIFAAAIMLLINPVLLRWDVGFQLSFLATLGIVALAPFWEKNLIGKNRAFGITEIAFLTLSAQIFVLPIILYNFHIFSTVSLVANILILPIVPLSMFLVFITAVSGFIFYPLSLGFAWLSYIPIKYQIWVVSTLSGLSWSSREVKNFDWLGIVAWYAIISGIIFATRKHKLKKSLRLLNELPNHNRAAK